MIDLMGYVTYENITTNLRNYLLALFQFMAGYDDAQLGAPEEDETIQKQESGGSLGHSTYDQLLLQSAAEDFEKNFQDQLYQ